MTISDDDLTRLLSDEPGPRARVDHGKLTDLVTADLLIDRHGRNLRYVHPWGQWLTWETGHWQEDQEGRAAHLAKLVVRNLLAKTPDIEDDKERRARIKDIQEAERAGRIDGCLKLARVDPTITAQPEHFDQNPWAFNLQNGTIDLQTGELRKHRREQLLTKQAPVAHDPAAAAPAWEAFLERVLPDPAVRLFLQRAVGYSLAGGNPAQILLILYGAGANGKSTFLEVTRKLLGPYGQQAPPETFLAKHDGIPNDVARLRGARFVAATEIGEGRRLNEPLIKRLTGGDTLVARYLRQEYFEFEPQFTPWLATNHKPEIRGTDEAIWRRIRLVPFTETIPPAERDENLKTKLAAELPGILNWALDGCAAWQADGLAEPEAVLAATAEYREDQDEIGAFLSDTCQVGMGQRCLAQPLYAAYREWSKANGLEALTAQSLGRRLSERGYQRTASRAGRGWLGVSVEHDQQELI